MTAVTFVFRKSSKVKSRVIMSGKMFDRISVEISGPAIDVISNEYDRLSEMLTNVVGEYYPAKAVGCRQYVGVCKFKDVHCKALVTYIQKICLELNIVPSDKTFEYLCINECSRCSDFVPKLLSIYKYG